LDTAQRLLDAEINNNTALNVASLMILTIGTICFGRDKFAKKCMAAGIRMGEELSLIGERRQSSEEFSSLSPDALSMLAYVAWGAFNLSTLVQALNVPCHMLTKSVSSRYTSTTSIRVHSQSARLCSPDLVGKQPRTKGAVHQIKVRRLFHLTRAAHFHFSADSGALLMRYQACSTALPAQSMNTCPWHLPSLNSVVW
jgi:hypothetical protein